MIRKEIMTKGYEPKEVEDKWYEYWEKNDPIDRYIRQLTENSWASQEELDATDRRIVDELDEAIKLVEPEPAPDVLTVLDGLTTEPPRAKSQWFDAV